MKNKYLKLMLKAPELFSDKIINHNNIDIEFNKNYIGEYNIELEQSMREISDSCKTDHSLYTPIKLECIYDDIDIDNIKSLAKETKTIQDWRNLIKLGFDIEHRLSMFDEWHQTNHIIHGWKYRISPNNKITLDDIRNKKIIP